jgi:hypothetical protein
MSLTSGEQHFGLSLAERRGDPLLHCPSCSASLAHDQRYCVRCGTRCGPPAPAVAALIATIAPYPRFGAPTDEEPPEVVEDQQATNWVSALQALSRPAVASAVMALLVFGVIVGSTISPAQPSAADSPILVAAAPPSSQAPAASPTSPTTTPPAIPASTPTPESSAGQEPSSAPAESTTSTTESATTSKPAATPKKTSKQKAKSPTTASKTTSGTGALPPIKHVFLIVLSDQGYSSAFGASSSAPYLSKSLPKLGELVPDYYAVTGGELANEIALISGQGPTPQTATNCPTYSAITPGTVGSEGQVLGSGCVYPQQTLTLADQLTAKHLTWKTYMEGIAEGAGAPGACAHPALGSSDPNQTPSPGDPYVTWRNPFVYFQSITGAATCAQDDTGLGQLTTDLKSASTTPSFAYIAPGPCQDGSEEPCAPGRPAGLTATNSFLEKIVPEIESSPAYSEGGLIAVTSDQAPQSGPNADSSGCCVTATYPNLQSAPSTGTGTTPSAQTPAGGGKVGLLLISKYVKPGSVNAIGEYNHFALLLSIEDLFGLKPLGYAGSSGLLPFDKSVFNAYK